MIANFNFLKMGPAEEGEYLEGDQRYKAINLNSYFFEAHKKYFKIHAWIARQAKQYGGIRIAQKGLFNKGIRHFSNSFGEKMMCCDTRKTVNDLWFARFGFTPVSSGSAQSF